MKLFLRKALNAKANDKNKIKRNLAQILVQDFKYDHDLIFREVALLYAFRELDTRPEEIPPQRIEQIKQMINNVPDQLKLQIMEHKIIPFMYDDRMKEKLIIAAIDPTDRNIPKIAFGLNAKKYEVIYIRKKDYDKLINTVIPPENVFLKMMEQSDESEVHIEDENSLDEDVLNAEINKSALINLVEGALVEGYVKAQVIFTLFLNQEIKLK
jgi:type IV pilus assembly protein PilB